MKMAWAHTHQTTLDLVRDQLPEWKGLLKWCVFAIDSVSVDEFTYHIRDTQLSVGSEAGGRVICFCGHRTVRERAAVLWEWSMYNQQLYNSPTTAHHKQCINSGQEQPEQCLTHTHYSISLEFTHLLSLHCCGPAVATEDSLVDHLDFGDSYPHQPFRVFWAGKTCSHGHIWTFTTTEYTVFLFCMYLKQK